MHKLLKKIFLLIVLGIALFYFNLTSYLGIYHERIELQCHIETEKNNDIQCLNHFAIDTDDKMQNKNILFIDFSYGCDYNKDNFDYLDSLFKNVDVNCKPIYHCDNLFPIGYARRKLSNAYPNLMPYMKFYRRGIRKSLHEIAKQNGLKEEIEGEPNRVFVISNNGTIKFACYSILNHQKEIEEILIPKDTLLNSSS